MFIYYLGLIIIIIWILWVELFFKYSKDRIQNLILKKYSLYNTPDTNIYYNIDNLLISEDKLYVLADVKLINKNTFNVIKKIPVKYSLLSDCLLTNKDCIAV